MKKIEAIVRTNKFEQIRTGLARIGVPFFTLQEVKGYGLQKGEHITYRGSSYDADFIPRLKMEIFSPDDKVEDIVQTIMQYGRTGEIGDGKILVVDIERIYRIRTGDSDFKAVY